MVKTMRCLPTLAFTIYHLLFTINRFMKLIVMMKQVANKDAILRINKEGTWIEEGDLSFEVSE